MKYRFSLIIVVLFATFSSLFAQDIKQYNDKYGKDFYSILKQVDEIGNFENKDFSCNMTIVSDKPGEEQEIMESKLFRRDKDEKFVLIILNPSAQKGQGYLQIGENVWFYDPTSRKFEHSSLKDNIQNSDAKNSDINSNSLYDDYNILQVEDSKLGKHPVWKMTLDAKTDDVSYKKVEIWVTKGQNLILKSQGYGFSGKLMRTTAYTQYKKIDTNFIPTKIIIVDRLNIGEKSQITMENMSVTNLKDSLFTKAFIESVSK